MTIRHPVPTCISAYEKSGGLPDDGRFPATAPRSAIEHWIRNDLLHLGFAMEAIAEMDYFDAVLASWTQFYTRMATSGLFLGDRDEIRLIPYGKDTIEAVVHDYRQRQGIETEPEAFAINDKADTQGAWQARGDAAVKTVAAVWDALGLRFPGLSIE